MSFKIFVAIAAAKGWPIHYVDIVTAFLYAELKELIEIKLPEGQRELYPDDIGLLMKTIYGLKQSPREWYRLLHDVLISMGFTRTQSDHSIFIKCASGKAPLFIMIYVDDLLVLSPSDVLKRYLAINVYYNKGVIYLSQYDYVDKILTRFGLKNCKAVATPIDEK
ncbi:hypothetical protein AAEP93_000055 [Penicillium crustosum]